jgi:hypothetical protein
MKSVTGRFCWWYGPIVRSVIGDMIATIFRNEWERSIKGLIEMREACVEIASVWCMLNFQAPVNQVVFILVVKWILWE